LTPPSPRPDRSSDHRTPVTLPPGIVSGLDTLAELPADASVIAWRVLRTLLLWAAEDPERRPALLDGPVMAEWEERLLTQSFDPDVRMPLAVIVAELARGEQAVAGRISWSCLCIADWALARRATRTALAFAEAAALVSPDQARYAWVAGRMLRTFGRFKDSSQWLQRAARAAARAGDWDAQAKSLNSLGNTSLHRGDLRDAARVLQVALRVARRRRMRQAEAENLHDLFVVHFEMDDWAQAEEHARAAFELYQQLRHDRLPMLVHDVAFFWINRGHFSRALDALRAVRPLMVSSEERLRILSSAIRAAGAVGERDFFGEMWAECWPLAMDLGNERRYAATALLQMGLGASSLGQWDRARDALDMAHEMARLRGEANVVHHVETALAAVNAERAAEPVRSTPTGRNSPGDVLASRMVSSLTPMAPRH
jgi:tetratricopeptide (TPR) repeat protein